ncbi:trafficking protein particle complex subunit 8 [Cimex lectularius]|uniref:Trafficking protein particle complex subunit 8 n=1 Tax=Cimex lectularius TaxID=79782 RepID=A0A8I6S449_CIMLE|nr:trafficking protein particle complex subunit 8 [Cimex lectularius]
MNMPTSKFTPQEFIQQTFAPMIAVISSEGVESCCQRNNLSFTEMLKPFSMTTLEGYTREIAGSMIQTKNLRLNFCDLNSRPPPPQTARSYFNQAVSSHIHDRTKEIVIGNCKFDIPQTVPWYEAWRHTFLQVQSPLDHEFVKHYIGCLIVISSLDSDPMALIAEMSDNVSNQILNGNHKLLKWFGPPHSILFTYLLLHDNSISDEAKSVATFEAIGATYGSQKCFILGINSRKDGHDMSNLPDPWIQYISSDISYKDENKDNEIEHAIEAGQDTLEKMTSPTPIIIHPLSPVTDDQVSVTTKNESNGVSKEPSSQHGMYLTSEDINKIKKFVNDFFVKALSPYFQQSINQLNEQVSNKKGMSRSLLSATKRWFGAPKPGSPGNHISPNAIAYSSDSHELQLRRLGDLCFMIGHYQMAFNAYHSAKRDFNADGAWLHYAGALEMAALSAFMANSDNLTRKVIDYFEESIVTYQNACRMNQFATRATIMSVECLKGNGLFGEAAKQLIRMAGEDSDLRSAVLLEQAAYCFLSCPRLVMYRKYAFHMVLAGNRFSKASHKNHSMRCYHQAYQVYNNKNWMIAEDHILYTIGKHATQLKLLANAYNALSLLVTRSSPQSEQQQQQFFEEYIIVVQNLLNSGVEVMLNLPVIQNHLTEIHLCVSTDVSIGGEITATCIDNSQNDPIWHILEEKLVNYAGGVKVMIFNPIIEIITSKSKQTVSAIAVCGETVGVYVSLKNPLHIPIKITGMQLTWQFVSENGEVSSNENCAYATAHICNEINLQADSTKHELLTITPNAVGTLKITGVNYSLEDSRGSTVRGCQKLLTLDKNVPRQNILDSRLQLVVIGKAPRLKVSFKGLKSKVYCNEIFPVSVTLKNAGALSISRILLVSSDSCSVWVKDCPVSHPVIFDIPLKDNLKSGESKELTIYIQPSYKKGKQNLELLFYYESEHTTIKPRYRLVKHSWPITVNEAFRLTALTSISNAISETDALNIRLQIDSVSVARCSTIMRMQIESVSISSNKWELGRWVIDPSVVMEEYQILFILIQALRKQGNSTKGTITTNYLLPNEINDVPFEYFLPKGSTSDNDIVCIVNWKLENTNNEITSYARGQEHIFLNNPINTSQNLSVVDPNTFPLFRDATKPLEDTKLVSCRIHLPQRVHHQFMSKRLCTIPVILNLQNCSDNKLSIKVSTSFNKTSKSNSLQSHSCCFSWVGQTSFTKIIDGYSDIGISLVAAVTTTGAYDFSSGLSVEVKVCNKYVKQLCNFDSITVIY